MNVSILDSSCWLRWALLLLAVEGCAAESAATSPEPPVLVARREEEVSFASDGLELKGTLLVPEYFDDQRLPAVILGHGSGPIDRDERVGGQLGMNFGFEIGVFEELAQALGDAGYVVLRFDKRSCTPARGCNNGYPPSAADERVDDYVTDLKAGLDWLHTRAEVAGEQLFYVGHSQGAQFAPELLAERVDLKAAAMLAGPYRPIDLVLQYQADWMSMLLAGSAAEDPDVRAIGQGVRQLEQLKSGSFTGTSILSSSVIFWQSWLDLAERAVALVPQLDRPLLALSGDYDWNVPPSETEAWAAAFASVPHDPGHHSVVLPCITHVLNCIRQPDWTLLTEDDLGHHVDPSVTAELVRFFDAQRP